MLLSVLWIIVTNLTKKIENWEKTKNPKVVQLNQSEVNCRWGGDILPFTGYSCGLSPTVSNCGYSNIDLVKRSTAWSKEHCSLKYIEL